jgi:hypothetical protein
MYTLHGRPSVGRASLPEKNLADWRLTLPPGCSKINHCEAAENPYKNMPFYLWDCVRLAVCHRVCYLDDDAILAKWSATDPKRAFSRARPG